MNAEEVRKISLGTTEEERLSKALELILDAAKMGRMSVEMHYDKPIAKKIDRKRL